MVKHGAAALLAACLAFAPHAAFAAKPVAEISFQLIDNRVFVPVMVDGRGPFSFVMDTGAPGWDMSASLMRTLGIKPDKSDKIQGAGESKADSYELTVDSVGLGGLHYRRTPFSAEDFSGMNDVIGFTRFDGVVGRPIFDSHAVEYDFARSRVRFYDPGEYVVPPGAIVIPFGMYAGFIPAIDGSIAGIRGRYIVDLGDRSSLTLFGPFWRAHKLDETLGPAVSALTGYGIGGPIHGELVRVRQFEIGPAEVSRVVARLSLQKSGAFADPAIAGSIGTGLLKRFRVAFDYPGRRIILVRDPLLDVADKFDRSGLWLGRNGSEYRVFDVIAGSPAMEAGLQADDIVTRVDGTPASKLDLFALRERLRDTSVAAVALAYRRGTASREVRLKLRDILPQG